MGEITDENYLHYLEVMRTKVLTGLDALHEGVSALHFVDISDYANVGDSVIALGQFAYWRERGIKVIDTFSNDTVPSTIAEAIEPVLLHGGGNFGGLYPAHSCLRYNLAQRLNPDTLLIQAPQTVNFVDRADEERFASQMASRQALRLGARDEPSYKALRAYTTTVEMVPDAVHALGRIAAPPPTTDIVVLARGDIESRDGAHLGVDWRPDSRYLRAYTRVASASRTRPWLRPAIRRSNAFWERRAQARLAHGIDLLAPGTTIVTDRLHAMLIGLQMGRRVVAIDNKYGKLSSYVSTWFGDAWPALTFAESFAEAIDLAR